MQIAVKNVTCLIEFSFQWLLLYRSFAIVPSLSFLLYRLLLYYNLIFLNTIHHLRIPFIWRILHTQNILIGTWLLITSQAINRHNGSQCVNDTTETKVNNNDKQNSNSIYTGIRYLDIKFTLAIVSRQSKWGQKKEHL